MEVLGVELRKWNLPERAPDRPPYLRPVVAQRRRRQVQALALDESAIQQLPEGRTRPIGAGSPLLDQVVERIIGGLGPAMHRLGYLLRLARDRVAAQVDLDLPHPSRRLRFVPRIADQVSASHG